MTFIRNCWYVAGLSEDLPAEGFLARTLINEPLVLYRTGNGEIVALEDRCCHRQAPLSLGRREGDAIRCMYHGLKFDSSGRCIEIPGQQTIPPKARVRRYPAVEKHSWLWVWMGDEAKADVTLIPPVIGADSTEWVMRSGSLDYQANHMLIHDNLCDLSHIAFLHVNTFGAGSDRMETRLAKITALPRGIRVERWSLPLAGNGGTPGMAVAENWMRYDYLAPGILMLRSESHPVGTAARCDHGAPDTPPLHANFTSQAVTPVTNDTSRYYFCWGPRAIEAQRMPAMVDNMFALACKVFREDQQMIEAQQRNLRLRPEAEPLMIAHDRGVTLMRLIFSRLAQEDAGSADVALAGGQPARAVGA